MAAHSEEKLICDQFNLEALTVNQVKSPLASEDAPDAAMILGPFSQKKSRLTLIVSYIGLFIFILIFFCASSE
jgi:hypothetical protein